jgi:hypothetical protein
MNQTLVKWSVYAATLSASLLAISAPVMAASLNVNSVTGTWDNVVGGSSLTGVGTNEFRWGEPLDGVNKSGLQFVGSAPPTFSVNTGSNFVLGALTHFNFEVFAPFPTGVDLNVNLNVSGVAQSFKYAFTINETPNGVSPVSACSAFQQSTVACDDRITFGTGVSSSSFMIDGEEYTLQLVGFSSTNDGSTPVSEFITRENQSNRAFLVGRITTPPPRQAVPEPAMLLGLSMLGVYLKTRVRK